MTEFRGQVMDDLRTARRRFFRSGGQFTNTWYYWLKRNGGDTRLMLSNLAKAARSAGYNEERTDALVKSVEGEARLLGLLS